MSANRKSNASIPAHPAIEARAKNLVISATLLALFLGALDALVMAAAMPTIVAELGGLDLYSWVYSAYLLARTVSLPIFGKLADIYRTKSLYIVSILVFILASLAAGFAQSMLFLIVCRAVQGIGAGGNFALVYIVLADVAPPEERGKTLSLGSFVWGLASVLGPTLGGFIVAYLAWPWIFFINVPLGLLSLAGVSLYLIETRTKKAGAGIDFSGAATLSISVLALLFIFLLAGRAYTWTSLPILILWAAAAVFAVLFVLAERRARDPLLPLSFFRLRGFSVGNAAVFMSSFAIFSFFAFAPLFIQGALGKSPVQVATTVLALSLGWSLGSLVLGRLIHRWSSRTSAATGAVLLSAGCLLTLTFTTTTSIATCFWVFSLVGVGMGFVGLATILVVQSSVDDSNLGVATASNQFTRNLGATVGIGICGSVFTAGFSTHLHAWPSGSLSSELPEILTGRLLSSADSILQPEVRAQLSHELLQHVNQAVAHGVLQVFWISLAAALACLLCCLLLPLDKR